MKSIEICMGTWAFLRSLGFLLALSYTLAAIRRCLPQEARPHWVRSGVGMHRTREYAIPAGEMKLSRCEFLRAGLPAQCFVANSLIYSIFCWELSLVRESFKASARLAVVAKVQWELKPWALCRISWLFCVSGLAILFQVSKWIKK